MSIRFALAVFVCLVSRSAIAIPEVAFPFNSQVPVVARVGEPYKFRFSSSTFMPSAYVFTYSLSNEPSWLRLDSATRKLSGTPAKEDAGAVQFVLTAADDTGAASMTCTLVVSTDPAPRLDGDISAELSASANLSSTEPAIVTLRPADPFSFVFQQSSFIDIVPRQLYYYATLGDHTPLPSWLGFDAQRLTFAGRAPDLSAFPQSWDIQLIASDVVGFSAATAAFTIAISTQQLGFVPAEQDVNITTGAALNFRSLAQELYRDGSLLKMEDIATAKAISLPSWLDFDTRTLAITGVVPNEQPETTFTVNVVDKAGNKAQTSIHLVQGNRSLLLGKIGSLTAYSGQPFQYSIPETLLSSRDITIDVRLPAQANWLSFNKPSRTLHGTVPNTAAPTTLIAALQVSVAGTADSEIQSFTIAIRDPTEGTGSPSPASNITPTTPGADNYVRQLSRGAIAAIVLCGLIGAAILAVLLYLCCRRREKNVSYMDDNSSTSRPSISRPVPSPPIPAPTPTSLSNDEDVGTTAGQNGQRTSPPVVRDAAPQIGRLSALGKRFSRASRVSSLGPGQDTIMADPNITEWGGEKDLLRKPHESCLVTSKMAALSNRWSRASETRKGVSHRKHESEYGLGLAMDPPSPRQKVGSSHSNGYKVSRAETSPRLREGSQASVNTSVLSEKRSLSLLRPTVSGGFGAFPVVPTRHPDRRNTVRLIDGEAGIPTPEGFKDKHDSYMRSYRSRRSATPVFANARGSTRQSRKPSRSYGSFSTTSSKLKEHRGHDSLNRLSTQRESLSSDYRSSRHLRRLSSRLRSVFSPEYPRVVVVQRQSTTTLREEQGQDRGSSTRPFDEQQSGKSRAEDSDDWHTSMSSNDSDARSISAMPEWLAEAQLPRHQRDWVHPFEASPTPEPPPKSHLRVSRSFHTASSRQSSLSQDFASPRLATAPLVAKRTTLSHPMRMVSKDSLAAVRVRPRLVDASTRRPAPIEEAKLQMDESQRQAGSEDATVGSEMWLEMTVNEIRSPTSKSSTVTSHGSGQPVFL